MVAPSSSNPGFAGHPAPTPITPRAKILFLPTTGQLLDPLITADLRERLYESLRDGQGSVAVIDLSGGVFTPGSLYELVFPLILRVGSGELGLRILVVIAEDEGVVQFVRMLSETHKVPLYVSRRPLALSEAEPAGQLTTTERETIDALGSLGGCVTVASFAESLNLQITAAGNRLINLNRRGYLERRTRSRRDGDAFVDPRTIAWQTMHGWWWDHGGCADPRAANLRPIWMEGEAPMPEGVIAGVEPAVIEPAGTVPIGN